MFILKWGLVIMFVKIANNISRIPTFYLLLIILFIGFILRTFSWFYFGTFLMEDDPHRMYAEGKLYISDYEYYAMNIATRNWDVFESFGGREHQPVYPLLLSLRHILDLPQKAYIFCLHHLLSIGTIYIVYLTAKRIFGVYYGLVSAFFISISAMMIFWFSWVYAETTFHFFLALLGLTATNLFKDKKPINYAFFFFSGFLCILTRPEGVAVFFIAILTLIYIHLAQKFSIKKALFIVAGIIFFLSSLLVSTLAFHKKSHETFFSQFHISLALYVSSIISTNSPDEQNQLYMVTMPEFLKTARSQPDYISDMYSFSSHGLNFIKENPFTWMKMYVLRLGANLFPSMFSPFWSLSHQLYSFAFSFTIVIGGSLALFFQDPRRFLATTLTLMAFSLILAINFFQREIDYRVPLSIYILFSTVAPYGWYKFYAYLKERFVHS